MRHLLSAVVQNVPGVLAHISGMLASRGYNIESLAVGQTQEPGISRMTFVVLGDERVSAQVRKQLEKIVTVIRVEDISSRDYVEREGVFNHAAIARLREEHRRGERDNGYELFAILIFDTWYRKYITRTLPLRRFPGIL